MNPDRRRAWNSTLPARTASLAPGGPLARSAELRGHPGLALVTRDGAPVYAPQEWQQRRRGIGFSRAVKLAARERAGDGDPDEAACEACGRWLGRYGGEVQHRLARGSGGCTDEVVNGITNAVLLCGHGAAPVRDGCHGACEDRDPHMRQDARGFWIEHGTGPEYDPRYVPVMLHSAGGGGMTVWLTEAGEYSCEPPDGGVA